MMRVFLDTNVLMDTTEDRRFSLQSKSVLELARRGHFSLYASYLTFANLNYLLRHRESGERYETIRKLHEEITVLPNDDAQLSAALTTEVKDFEDMLQYQCAKAAGCDIVVTNNGKDYQGFCDIPFMSTEDFLIQIFSQL